jgi:hypothetical protein
VAAFSWAGTGNTHKQKSEKKIVNAGSFRKFTRLTLVEVSKFTGANSGRLVESVL